MPRRLRSLVGTAGICLSLSATAATPSIRLLVLTSAPADVGAGVRSSLTKQIEQEIPASQHGTVMLVPPDELQPALAARRKSADQCRREKSCVEAIAREMAADLVVTAALDHEGKTFLLTIARSAWAKAAAPQSTSAHVSSLSNLRLNVRICLGRLFPDMASTSVADLPLIADESETPAPQGSETPGSKPLRAGTASPAAPPAGERLVVVAGAVEGVDAKVGSALPEQVAMALAAVHPSRIVPAADVRNVLAEREDSVLECLEREHCPAVVASRLDAKLFVTALIQHSRSGYSLTLTRGSPLRLDRQSTSEPMKKLTGLEVAIRLCLARLFPAAAVAAAPQ